jgi:Icc-related predicted phosphoesterase
MPKGVDVLVTHQPPFGVLDCIKHGGFNVGSKHLREAVLKY